MASPKVSIFIDKYHPGKGGLCAVSIRITFNKKRKYYPTTYSLSPSDFEKTQGSKPRHQHKEIAMDLQAAERKALQIIEDLPVFTWDTFERYFLHNRSANNTVNEVYQIYTEELRASDNIGTAVSYECAARSINKFAPEIKFADVTPDFLKKFEKWMLMQKRSVTTISIYLRTLRTIFNNGIAEGTLSKEIYPFGKKKFQIPFGNNTKKALTLHEISQLYYFKPPDGLMQEKARDFWFFMYLCNGINVKDMCLLKYENIKEDILEFERAKTAHTKRKVEAIRVSLCEDAKHIIKKYGNPRQTEQTYIFNILRKGLTAVRERELIQLLTALINKNMKKIAAELGIKSHITTYSARHSFATILLRSGASTEFISEALGHSNVKTTQNYLAGFEDDFKKQAAKALTAFKDII